jgi:hypothetical protein
VSSDPAQLVQYEVRSEQSAKELIDDLARVHRRVGVAGLLACRGRRARVGRAVSPVAVETLRWQLRDGWSRRWWPQGIEVLSDGVDGVDGVLAVSWFAQRRRGRSQGARISVIDRRDSRRPRYHHVLLVEPTRLPRGGVGLAPVAIHAGGLARLGDALFAAATFEGLRRFDLRDILRVSGRGPFGYRYVLPQSARETLHGGEGDQRMRASFVSVEHGTVPGERAVAGPSLIMGEFGAEGLPRRLARLPAPSRTASDAIEIVDIEQPRIPRMQGAAVIDGTWFVSSSDGLEPGDLWVGDRTDATAEHASSTLSWRRHRRVLPMGPEDLTVSTDGTRLWSLCEYPRHRAVYAMDAQRWRDEPGDGPAEPPTAGTSPA